jgi:hypothetical protein
MNQAAHGMHGLAVFNAGGLLRMQQQAVVKQQAQPGAVHRAFFARLFGQLDPAVMGFPVFEKHLSGKGLAR